MSPKTKQESKNELCNKHHSRITQYPFYGRDWPVKAAQQVMFEW
ncbi:hypothetical protein [Desulfobacula sp.]